MSTPQNRATENFQDPHGGVNSEQALAGLEWYKPPADLTKPVPLADLLQGLQLLGTDQARTESNHEAHGKWDGPTPASLQVLKSGVTEVTKHWTKRIQTAGGIPALITGFLGLLTPVAAKFEGWDPSTWVPIAVALLGGAAIVLAAVSVALAVFVQGDLQARGLATAARHQGRAAVASAFLQATAWSDKAPSPVPSPPPGTGSNGGRAIATAQQDGSPFGPGAHLIAALAAFGPSDIRVDVPSEGITNGAVTRVKAMPNGLRVCVNQTWIPLDQVATFATK